MGDFWETIPQVHTACTATMKVTLASLLLIAGASAMPKADPQIIGAPLVPSLYHTQNCTNQEDTITTKRSKLPTLARLSLSNDVDWSQLRPRLLMRPLWRLREGSARLRLTPRFSCTHPTSPPLWCHC